MNTMIVYDSYFGNTEKIARAVAAALEAAGKGPVTVARAEDTQPDALRGLHLLVVGAPTRAFRPTERMQAFLKRLTPGALNGVKVAAFDTRIKTEDVNNKVLSFMTRLFGYAAEPIGKALVKAGGQQVAAPEGFFVTASEGPLKDGELARAETWARGIAAAA